MADKCVVRNQACRRGGVALRQRHNERQNTGYANPDVVLERAHLNVHYKSCEGSYTEAFDKLVADGHISTRGLGKDPKILDELVFDVNTAYFENHGAGSPCGGYDYAKEFFAEAYRLAVKEAGGEQYVLSAVMHADERNKALSEQLGRDVYHYHLHVVYVPVVEKKVYFKKNNKDPEKAGKLKETIMQVSHSKKWPRLKQLDEHGEPLRNAKGKAILINAYSLLQDRFHEHMREAGYTDFERGERGSTAEHLSVLEYKTQQEAARLEAVAAQVAQGQQQAAEQDATARKKKKELAGLDKKLAVKGKAAATLDEVKSLSKNVTIGGKVALAPGDWRMVYSLAKEGLHSREEIQEQKDKAAALRTKNAASMAENADMKERLKGYGEGVGVTDTMRYFQAKQRAPRRMEAAIVDILHSPAEKQQEVSRQRQQGHRKGGQEL
ncbi:plasmid recombination protein [Ruminococcaceae bacterium OttesenSCG-928-D13]|nr:plasmid recombination protein [Ruminococcaceae bacterium OttesenSCG-928-D13]